MSIQDFINEYYRSGILTLFLCGAVIQIAPIKINPYTWIAKKIGRAINSEVIEKVNSIEKRLEAHIQNDELENVRATRQRILHFDAECCKGERHTLEQYNEILEDVDAYEKYCAIHTDYKNNKAVSAMNTIKMCYEQDKLTNNFL